MTLVLRTAIEPESLTRAMVGAVRTLDPEQPVLDIMTMESVVEDSLGQRRFAMLLLSAFAALALVLASVGIYSVLAYAVRQRVREIGICMALGAPSGGVLKMIVVEGLKPTLVGVGLGLLGAAWLVRVLATLLFGITARDPGTFTAVTAIVIVVGLVAMLVPAYRATRIDPIATLRAEGPGRSTISMRAPAGPATYGKLIDGPFGSASGPRLAGDGHGLCAQTLDRVGQRTGRAPADVIDGVALARHRLAALDENPHVAEALRAVPNRVETPLELRPLAAELLQQPREDGFRCPVPRRWTW